jgi:hypothetical protein
VHGYLRSLLDALAVPAESQALVFSQTSFQAPRIKLPQPAGGLLHRYGGRRLGARRRHPRDSGSGSGAGRHLLRARSKGRPCAGVEGATTTASPVISPGTRWACRA